MGAKAHDFEPGTVLPGTKYRVVKTIGAGGMGTVFQVVKEPEIQGVLKLMSQALTSRRELRTRFFDEVRVLAQLDHPNIVRVFDYDSLEDGTPFYVMELLHGRTVRDVLTALGKIPPRVAYEIARQLCEALHCAHTHDIPVIHRDIKPENIFLHAPRHGEPTVKLIDFGVIAVGDRQHDGAFVGTWRYAAPEQIRGLRATPATDLYAVALVLYEMLCGEGPFDDLPEGSLLTQAHLHQTPPSIAKTAPWVPTSIVRLIEASLAKDPAARPPDAHAFAEHLYELEWATNNEGRTEAMARGPRSRVLSTVVPATPPPPTYAANVPPLPLPRRGPTLLGLGENIPHAATSPPEPSSLASPAASLGPLLASDTAPPTNFVRSNYGPLLLACVAALVLGAAASAVHHSHSEAAPSPETEAAVTLPMPPAILPTPVATQPAPSAEPTSTTTDAGLDIDSIEVPGPKPKPKPKLPSKPPDDSFLRTF
jgi:serine/threonine-protein kinase